MEQHDETTLAVAPAILASSWPPAAAAGRDSPATDAPTTAPRRLSHVPPPRGPGHRSGRPMRSRSASGPRPGQPVHPAIVDGAEAAADDLNVDPRSSGRRTAVPRPSSASSIPRRLRVQASQPPSRASRWPAGSTRSSPRAIIVSVPPARDLVNAPVRRRALRRERAHPRPEVLDQIGARRPPARSSSATASRASVPG